jgi:hypothetical protein
LAGHASEHVPHTSFEARIKIYESLLSILNIKVHVPIKAPSATLNSKLELNMVDYK